MSHNTCALLKPPAHSTSSSDTVCLTIRALSCSHQHIQHPPVTLYVSNYVQFYQYRTEVEVYNSCSRRRWIIVRKPAQSRGVPTARRTPEPTTDPDTVFYPRQRHVTATPARHVGVTACSVLGYEAHSACASPSGTPSPPPHTSGVHAPVLVVPSGCEPRSPDVSVSLSVAHQTVRTSRNDKRLIFL